MGSQCSEVIMLEDTGCWSSVLLEASCLPVHLGAHLIGHRVRWDAGPGGLLWL